MNGLITIQPIVKFRCRTCLSIIFDIDQYDVFYRKLMREHHTGCKLEYFNLEQYENCLNLEDDVTLESNTLHKERKRFNMDWFAHKARIINNIGLPFTQSDFPELLSGNYRQYIRKFGDEIVKITGGHPSFYRFRDIYTGFEKRFVTLEGMGVGRKFENQLRRLRMQKPALHDIKIMFHSKLHQILKETNEPDKRNGLIIFKNISLNKYISANISVYPNIILIDISCTYSPIICDTKGVLEFTQYLEKLRIILYGMIKGKVGIPNPLGWTITQYHLNQDGKIEYDGNDFHLTVDEFALGVIRCYVKNFPDGKRRLRIEKISTKKTIISDQLEWMKKFNDPKTIPQIYDLIDFSGFRQERRYHIGKHQKLLTEFPVENGETMEDGEAEKIHAITARDLLAMQNI